MTRLSTKTWDGTPDLNEGLPAGTISSAAKQPLAFNLDLITAARNYSQTILDNNSRLDHEFGGTTPVSRATAQGYTGASQFGENLSIDVRGNPIVQSKAFADGLHDQLFIDAGVASRGHRLALMNTGYREVGLGLAQSSTYTGFGEGFPHALLLTEDFGTRSTAGPFLTGAIFSDNVLVDNFYSPGEGIGNVTITAVPTAGGALATTTTWSSGGYTLAITAGTYTVTAVGTFGTINLGSNVVVSTDNVELNGNAVPEPASLSLLSLTCFGFLTRSRRSDRV